MNAVADAATAGRNDPACVTDGPTRPTDRVDVIVISQSPAYLLLEKQTHPDPGGFFALQKHKGQGSLCPSAPSLPNRWGRLTSPAWSLGGLSRAGNEGTAEYEQAKRASSFRAAGSRTTEKTQRRESEAKKSESRHLGKLASRKVG